MMCKVLTALLLALAACVSSALAQTTPAAAPSTAAQSGERKDDCGCDVQALPDVLAIVNGVKITGKEINAPVAERVSALEQQVIEARKRELDLQINSKLLEAEAKRRGTTTTKLLEEEIISKVKDPTDAEVQAFYDQNKSRIGAELKDARGDIAAYLHSERERQEAQKLAERLRAAAQVKVLVQNVTPPATPAERALLLATVNGERITSEDIETSLRSLVFDVQRQIYRLRQQELDLRINDTLLQQEAQKRGVTPAALLDAEVAAKTRPVTEADARAFYEQNKERINGDFTQMKAQITQYLQERETRSAQTVFAERLRRASSVQTFLTPPAQPVYSISTDDQPSLGNADAPVTIVEFTDYQCASCAAAQPVVERLLKEYEGRVRLFVRDFPLQQHADAFKAAEAAEAAREQGKYREYTSLLMRNQSALGVERLKEYAGQLGLDRRRFDAALDSGKFADKVQRDLRDGQGLGIQATPTFFINGRAASEATYEALKAAIEAALKEPVKKP